MATIKYRKKEFTPSQNQQGMTHCWYAESVIVNELDTIELARLIEARTGVRRYEAQSVLASFVELINEECAQSMRIKLSDEKGQKFVSIYPKISGSISDKDVQANPDKYNGATVATEAMLTPDMLTVTLAATIGVSTSKQFAKNASIQKVAANVTGIADEDEGENGSSQSEANGGSSANGSNGSNGSSEGGGTNGGNQGSGTGTIDTSGGNTGGNGGSTDPDDGDEG